jgi:hypothetical protein
VDRQKVDRDSQYSLSVAVYRRTSLLKKPPRQAIGSVRLEILAGDRPSFPYAYASEPARSKKTAYMLGGHTQGDGRLSCGEKPLIINCYVCYVHVRKRTYDRLFVFPAEGQTRADLQATTPNIDRRLLGNKNELHRPYDLTWPQTVANHRILSLSLKSGLEAQATH